MSQRLVGLLLFPRVTQLDLTGPYEVFARLPNTRVHLVADRLDPVEIFHEILEHRWYLSEQEG